MAPVHIFMPFACLLLIMSRIMYQNHKTRYHTLSLHFIVKDEGFQRGVKGACQKLLCGFFPQTKGGGVPPNLQLIFRQNKFRGGGYQLIPHKKQVFLYKNTILIFVWSIFPVFVPMLTLLNAKMPFLILVGEISRSKWRTFRKGEGGFTP